MRSKRLKRHQHVEENDVKVRALTRELMFLDQFKWSGQPDTATETLKPGAVHD